MPIRKTHQSPKVGDTFTKTFKSAQHKMTVVEVGKGVGYRIGKTVYKSPSAAAKSITQTAVNGWAFWHMEK